MTLPPICIFAFNRADKFAATLEALIANHGSKEYELYIFIDGPRNAQDAASIEQIAELADSLTHFKSVHIARSEQNKGLAPSIIAGVSEVLKSHSSIIVLEDDLITSRNFLSYMTQALDFYQDHAQVGSISGFSHSTFNYQSEYEGFFQSRAWSWGWGTWRHIWEID